MLQLGPNLYTNFQAARLPQHCSDNSIECADMNLQRAYGPFLFNSPGNENVGGNQDGKKGWLLCVMYTTHIYIYIHTFNNASRETVQFEHCRYEICISLNAVEHHVKTASNSSVCFSGSLWMVVLRKNLPPRVTFRVTPFSWEVQDCNSPKYSIIYSILFTEETVSEKR